MLDSSTAEVEADRRTVRASALLGGFMLLVAVFVLVDGMSLPGADAVIGPGAVPITVGVLLAAVGAALLVRALRQLRGIESKSDRPAGGALRVAGLVITLVAFAVLLPVLGYVVATAGLFTSAALLLGAPRSPHTFAYGWALAAIVYLVFDRLIGLTLPAGPWGF